VRHSALRAARRSCILAASTHGRRVSTEAEAGLTPRERTGNGHCAEKSWPTTSRVHGNGSACPCAEGLSNNALQQTSGAARMDAARS
jgi:hypothetical protein